MSYVEFEVQGTWDGGPLEAGEFARIEARIDRARECLDLKIDASYHADPAPDEPPGPVDGLWNFEVVELFLLGDGERYLEIELGPHGHHLGLLLVGRRQVVESQIPIAFRATRSAATWSGRAQLSLSWLPPNVFAANAYAIHGQASERRYLAAHPVPGPTPDFHRLEYFGPSVFVA